MTRSTTATTIATLGLTAVLAAGSAAAAPATITLEGSTHVINFTTPGIYDFSANESSSDGVIANATLISHDLKGKIDGIIIDKGASIELTTEITGTCKRSGGVTVITEKMKGYGDLGNGDVIASRGKKRSEVRGAGAGAILFSVLKVKTCTKFKQPFSEKYSTVCGTGGGEHQTLIGDRGDWQVRMELQQPVVGEILGTGSISTNVHSAQFKRTTEVIVAGRYDEKDGTAKLKLTPLFAGGDGPVTILAEVVAGGGVQWPAVTNVLEVKGKLLGQKFNEVTFQ
jgi:hypothetical protein